MTEVSEEQKSIIYNFFSDYIYNESGMIYLEKDYYRLESRLKNLAEIYELDSEYDVYKLYQSNITADMKSILINISTNNETYFFRDVKPFKALTNEAIPLILKNFPTCPTINIWSAACSFGQEAYSILMSIDKKCGPSIFNQVSIDATDISTEALDKAKSGIYNGLDVQRGLPITELMKYFEQLENEDWKIQPRLSDKLNLSEFNLLKGNFPTNRYHIIFCRNVLIYQDKENKNKIFNKLYQALKPNGFLFLGNGESLIGMETDFIRFDMNDITVYQKKPE